jgi:glucokinase
MSIFEFNGFCNFEPKLLIKDESMSKKLAVGVDIGGSHISCAVCNLDEKKYLPETFSESDLDNKGTSEEIIRVFGNTIRKTMDVAGSGNIAGIGFAMPGPFDYAKGIALFTGDNNKYENIYGLDVPKALRKFLKLQDSFPIRFINDATAFAIGEDWIGKASGTRRSLSITLGTGFGSAFLNDSLPVVSGDTVPEMGCMWHLPFENGTADDYFSTRGFLNRFQEKTGRQLSGVKDLARLAQTDPAAKSLFDDFGEKLAVFLESWIKTFGVEALVIGGNISNAFDLFEPSLKSYLSTAGVEIKIAASELKETASIIGSAVLVNNDFYEKVNPLLPYM